MRSLALGAAAGALVVAGGVAATGAVAADNPYQRGPAPTAAGIAATRGTFATAQTTVPAGNGFGGGVIYYPTDTSQGTFAAIAIAPGFGTAWSYYAWLGPRLASFGFVVIGIETNSLSDYADARGAQLLSALDYLTGSSPVRARVDPSRLAVGGHSMGGGGAIVAGQRRPSLATVIGMAPYVPDGSLRSITMPTVLFGGQTDGTVTPAYLASAYGTLPTGLERAYVEIANEGHGFAAGGGGGNSGAFARTMLLWMKLFMDRDTRYAPFLCPSLSNSAGISKYQASCPLDPPGGAGTTTTTTTRTTTTTTTSRASTTSTTGSTTTTSSTGTTSTSSTTSGSTGGGACQAAYRTVTSWPGGFQGEVTVTAGTAPVPGWTVRWALSGAQSISSLWSGTLTTSGADITVSNASYNGSLAAGGSTTFGFIAAGSPSNPALSCTSP